MSDIYRVECNPDGLICFFHNEKCVFHVIRLEPKWLGISDGESFAIFDCTISTEEIDSFKKAAGI